MNRGQRQRPGSIDRRLDESLHDSWAIRMRRLSVSYSSKRITAKSTDMAVAYLRPVCAEVVRHPGLPGSAEELTGAKMIINAQSKFELKMMLYIAQGTVNEKWNTR